jgi:glucose-6-phosphate dehydrogenase assembly protein OpcA
VTVGGTEGLGELVELRMRGPLAQHVSSVVLPLLVPDAPVVAWWPGASPAVPSADPVGRLAQRRITDAAACSRPLKELDARRAGYAAGDTDLSWTRLTPWRSLIAASLDLPHDPITGATVGVQRGNPSGPLLASWLTRGLGVPVSLRATRGPGVTAVSLHTEHGDISISRPDGRVARLSRPGMPDREAALPRRSTDGLVAEELRRLDPDEVYGEALAGITDVAPSSATASRGATAPSSRRRREGART